METSIVIDLNNDEFQESLQGLAWILRGIADNIDRGKLPMDTQWLVDSNGNRVGTWKLINR